MVYVTPHARRRWLERLDPATPDAAASVRGSLAAAMPFRPDTRELSKECRVAIRRSTGATFFVNAADGAVFVCVSDGGRGIRVVTVLRYAEMVRRPRAGKW